MTPESVARALGGRKMGNTWTAPCPAHDDHEPSLSISTGEKCEVLIYCHAGCDQSQVITALRSRGLWDDHDRQRGNATRRTLHRAVDGETGRTEVQRSEGSLRIWQASVPVPGTLVGKYLESRGLHVPPPSSIRFHSGLKHPTGGIWPCMVALVTREIDHAPLAITRTYLACDGSGKAPVAPPKMMLGPCGGGAVRLGVPSDSLMVGEGVETMLSVQQETGRPCWAALSCNGLKSLILPDNITSVTICADNDEPGEQAARAAAKRWKSEGRKVRIARPPDGHNDFNDALRAGAITDAAIPGAKR